MSNEHLDYGDRGIELGFSPDQVVRPNGATRLADARQAVREALRSPVGSPPLTEIAERDGNVALILSDSTRIFGQKAAAEVVVEELGKAGQGRLTVVIAYGNHPSEEESALDLPGNLPEGTRIWHHKYRASEDIVQLGSVRTREKAAFLKAAVRDAGVYAAGGLKNWWEVLRATALGGPVAGMWRVGTGITGLFVKMVIAAMDTPVEIARPVAEADLVVTVGQVKPHFFTGYGGGVKGVVPGVSSMRTIARNHFMMRHPSARLGVVEGNICREDLEAATALGPRVFAVNVVADARGEMVAVTAGDVVSSHREAVKAARRMCRVTARRTGIVVAGTRYPEGLEFYQLMKIVAPAAVLVKKGGAIVIAGPCPRGMGRLFYVNEVIYELLLRHIVPRGVKLIAYTEMSKRLMRATHFTPATSPGEAMEIARRHAGRTAEVTLLKDAGMLDPVVDGG